MKKIILLVSLSVVTLFAASIPAYVYRVESYFTQYNQYLYEPTYSYTDKVMNEARPSPSTGYILPTTVDYFKTLYVHEGSQPNYIKIYVHYPNTLSSTDVVGIRVRNFYKLFNGLNGIEMKAYDNDYSSYQMDVYPQADGSKLISYWIPDTTDYYKEITVTTCPNGQLPTAVDCQFVVVDIAGTDNYGLNLR